MFDVPSAGIDDAPYTSHRVDDDHDGAVPSMMLLWHRELSLTSWGSEALPTCHDNASG